MQCFVRNEVAKIQYITIKAMPPSRDVLRFGADYSRDTVLNWKTGNMKTYTAHCSHLTYTQGIKTMYNRHTPWRHVSHSSCTVWQAHLQVVARLKSCHSLGSGQWLAVSQNIFYYWANSRRDEISMFHVNLGGKVRKRSNKINNHTRK